MKAILMLTVVVITLGLVSIASAAPGDGRFEPQQQDLTPPCDVTQPVEVCFSATPDSGGNYLACTALGTKGQGCQDAVNNRTECATVYRAGSCNCDPKTMSVTGTCTYIAR